MAGPLDGEGCGVPGVGADLLGLADSGTQLGQVGIAAESGGLVAQIRHPMFGAAFGQHLAAACQLRPGFEAVELECCGPVEIAGDGAVPSTGSGFGHVACRGDGVGAFAVGEEAEEAAAALEGAEGSRVAGDGSDGAGDAALAGEASPSGFCGGRIGIGLGELVA
ncbi:MAG: hypothetical protein WDN69_15470 [Aliidongia sp.]